MCVFFYFGKGGGWMCEKKWEEGFVCMKIARYFISLTLLYSFSHITTVMSVYMYLCIYIYVYIYVGTHVYMYIYRYIHTRGCSFSLWIFFFFFIIFSFSFFACFHLSLLFPFFFVFIFFCFSSQNGAAIQTAFLHARWEIYFVIEEQDICVYIYDICAHSYVHFTVFLRCILLVFLILLSHHRM